MDDEIETIAFGERVRWEQVGRTYAEDTCGWRLLDEATSLGYRLWKCLVTPSPVVEDTLQFAVWNTYGWTPDMQLPPGTTLEQAKEATLNILRIGTYGPTGDA